MSDQPQFNVHLELVGADFDALEKKFDEAFDKGMEQLAKEIEKTWRDKAEQTLDTSKKQYLEGLSVESVGKDHIQATLTGFLPVGVEEGHEGYDMKPGLLKNYGGKPVPIGLRAGEKPRYTFIRPNSEGWQHPGFQARKIHEQVQREVGEKLTHDVFEPLISRISV